MIRVSQVLAAPPAQELFAKAKISVPAAGGGKNRIKKSADCIALRSGYNDVIARYEAIANNAKLLFYVRLLRTSQ